MSTGEVQVVGGDCIPDLTKCVWHMLMGAFECFLIMVCKLGIFEYNALYFDFVKNTILYYFL